ncbi:hypothetical protein HU200_054397 [Digitaria exilis]|uniref:Pectinesterase inhibitor domain-containing protein n=1 Tax=Digitaria exilis TaxID=1010633 RepID=A0A835AIJ6_9POAL|nr:hypothetical protein HU200_054397 [Digitaria exilis]
MVATPSTLVDSLQSIPIRIPCSPPHHPDTPSNLPVSSSTCRYLLPAGLHRGIRDSPRTESDPPSLTQPLPLPDGLNGVRSGMRSWGMTLLRSIATVIDSIPGIQAANIASNISDLCLHFAANKTTEAKALADTVLAATKGKAPYCLEACAKSVSSMADVLVDLPAKQDDMNAYLTAKNFRAKFKHEDPPICQKDCRNESSTADETLLANKFHNIWNVVKVANCQIEQMFPWPDSEDDDSDLA